MGNDRETTRGDVRQHQGMATDATEQAQHINA